MSGDVPPADEPTTLSADPDIIPEQTAPRDSTAAQSTIILPDAKRAKRSLRAHGLSGKHPQRPTTQTDRPRRWIAPSAITATALCLALILTVPGTITHHRASARNSTTHPPAGARCASIQHKHHPHTERPNPAIHPKPVGTKPPSQTPIVNSEPSDTSVGPPSPPTATPPAPLPSSSAVASESTNVPASRAPEAQTTTPGQAQTGGGPFSP